MYINDGVLGYKNTFPSIPEHGAGWRGQAQLVGIGKTW
jgi:hypothetical protein